MYLAAETVFAGELRVDDIYGHSDCTISMVSDFTIVLLKVTSLVSCYCCKIQLRNALEYNMPADISNLCPMAGKIVLGKYDMQV